MFEALGEHNEEDSFRSFAARALDVLGELSFVVSTVARRTLWKELDWTIGQPSELANALKAARQYVQQEATYELVGLEGHQRLLVSVTVVAPFEGNVAIFQRQ